MPKKRSSLFRGRHFRDESILRSVVSSIFVQLPGSGRNDDGERGLSLDRSTIARWVLRYARPNWRLRSIEYAPKRIAYTKFDDASQEEFNLGAGKPKSVGGRMNWDAGRKVLIVRSTGKAVTISLE